MGSSACSIHKLKKRSRVSMLMKLYIDTFNIIWHTWITLKKIYRAVFKIFWKVLQSKIMSSLSWQWNWEKVSFLGSRKPREKTQTNKTFLASSKYNFHAYFGVFWSNFIKIVFLFQSFKFHYTKSMVWMFS